MFDKQVILISSTNSKLYYENWELMEVLLSANDTKINQNAAAVRVDDNLQMVFCCC